jgi:phytoene desaturase
LLKTVAVIGSGIAGLSIANRLVSKGFEVTIFEANDFPGGKITEHRENGYRFDMGPSVLTMPHYLDELFEIAGEDPRQYFNYERLDPVFKYFFEDGNCIQTHASKEKTIEELVSKTTVAKADVETFFKRAEEKLLLTDPVFLQRSLHIWKNYLDMATLKGVLNFHRIEAFTTMADANLKLFKDEKVTAIFNQYAAYNGSSPFLAPATLNLIAHYELSLGAFYPKGGMHSITESLLQLAKHQGVNIELNSSVDRVLIENKRAIGVSVKGRPQKFDLVVSNADVSKTYSDLIPNQSKPTRVLEQPKSSSVIVFYWGIKREFDSLGLHNMFMSANQKTENEAIFKSKTISSDPTVYLYISSKGNKGDAPKGFENWFAMITVPHNSGQDWDSLVDQARKDVLLKLSRILKTDIEPLIGYEHVLDPRTVEAMTGCTAGSIYGNSSNGKFAAFLRHPNFSSKIKNLFFCGGSVHPGSSIPLSLLSAKITSNLIEKD